MIFVGILSITLYIVNLNYVNLAFLCFLWCLNFYITYDLCVCYHLACEKGHFGTNCSQVCSPNCIIDTCRPTDGLCTCAEGWTGRNCTTGNSLVKIFIVLYIHVGNSRDQTFTVNSDNS